MPGLLARPSDGCCRLRADKQRLAGYFPENVDAYYDIKDPVFDVIMEGAYDWVKLTGWSEPPGD